MPPKIRHVLVTGGSRGIGLSIAQLFAQNAYRCTLLSRSEANLERALQTLDPLESPPPSHTHGIIAGDVSSASFWSASQLGAALKSRGDAAHIDVLVNCAGITQSKLFTTTAPEDIQAVVDTNLTSLMLGTRFLLRSRFIGGLKRARVSESGADGWKETDDFSPVVINVASLLGLQGGYGAVAYAASKAGVLGFTRALAGEYASHGVRVNALVPGYVETDMTKGWFAFCEFYDGCGGDLTFPDLNTAALQERIPLKRFGRADEIAHAALFLAQNQYAHNCVINIDGGLSAV